MIEGTAILGRRGRKKKCGQILSESQKVTGGDRRRRSIDTITTCESDYFGHNKQTSQEGFKDGTQQSHLFKCLKHVGQRRVE